ncbi:ABC transporter permease [Lignipirellula cremea]|uniref:Dipeptide transport system permease protein DppB n=1 Tax=Lignipirellula cremea TaxID=2528010 RepID=A0A518DTP7_9BACT|nr:ABC transporter permease [Lignipirellula cremea]QDU95221.1 Dipeptide transport system permease protein DppB [Lignipirellula cremea]
MTGYLLRRIAQAAATMLVAMVLIFIALRVIPGNPLLARFGQHPDQAAMERLEKEYGWDKPLPVQIFDYFWKLFTAGDLGRSIARPNESVSSELAARIPATLELTLAAVMLAIPLGVLAGVAAAVWRNRLPDLACMTIALLGVSIPVFFLGILLREIFTQMPTSGRLPSNVFDYDPITGLVLLDTLLQGRMLLFGEGIRHLCLPAITLSTIPTAVIARITRSSMLEVLDSDYVRTARAKGCPPWRVVWRQAFPNATPAVVNIAAFQIGMLLSGAVLTETIFDWPGLGKYVTDAVSGDKDYVVVQACAMVIAAVFVTTNLLVDMVYVWLDPRIRLT